MSEVTEILCKIESGDSEAAAQLLPLVYEELRKLAAVRMSAEKAGQTLQTTALVHEAYLRIVDVKKVQQWNGRGHFFAAAAEAMRRILIDRARDKKRLKRSTGLERIDLDSIEIAIDTPADELLALDESLLELADQFPESAELVKLRFFGGMTLKEAADTLGIPPTTADRKWAFARAWLRRRLAAD